MCVATVTHTIIHQKLQIMIDEEYKENVEYILSTILPKLQEIQKKYWKINQDWALMLALAIKTAKGI